MMSGQLMTQVKVQLTAAMDAALQGTVREVMKILKKTLRDQQQQMIQKDEELVQLKIKLQTAERRLVDLDSSSPSKVVTIPTQTESFMVPPKQAASDDDEMDVEAPDEWCAPIGHEVPIKEEDVCPSVRLRQFSIPLWHVPIHGQESPQSKDVSNLERTIGGQRSQRVSAIKAKTRLIVNKKCSAARLESLLPKRSDMKRLVKDMESVYSDQTGVKENKLGKHSTKTLKKNLVEFKKEQSTDVGTQSGSTKTTPLSDIKIKLVKVARSAPKASVDKEKKHRSSEIKQNNSAQSSDRVQQTPKIKFACNVCYRTFRCHSKLVKHAKIYGHTQRLTCEMCPRRFNLARLLAKHMKKEHRNSSKNEPKKNLDWTKPLERTNDREKNLLSSSEKTDTKVVYLQKYMENIHLIATPCFLGFICHVCQKTLRTKHSMIEHFRRHTIDTQ